MTNKIILAKTAGFCFGVKRAVFEAEKAAGAQKGNIFSYGELIHNPQEILRLKKQGIIPMQEQDLKQGETVLIRAHGVKEKVIEKFLNNKINIIDLTCPFVKKIHSIVKKHSDMGYKAVIIGDENHPEVIGIRGWCKDSLVIADVNGISKILKNEKICVVAQTTIGLQKWNEIITLILRVTENAAVFNTVCLATRERQEEAVLIAEEADIMFVVGGKSSANTKKLYELCLEACSNTFYIENADEISGIDTDGKVVGITAGASTPGHIIKEVINKMTEEKNGADISFQEALLESFKSLNNGDTVTGTVLEIRPTEILVDLGYKSDGIIPISELSADPDIPVEEIAKVGDEITAFVVRINDVDGQVTLSRRKVEFDANYKNVLAACESREVLTGKVVGVMNAGIQVLVNGVKVFVPASQASDRFVEDLSTLKGKTVNLRIIEVNERRRRITGSIKSVLKEENKKLKDEFWADVTEGKKYKGKVKSVTDFGAFVDIGGIDGLVHITELSWKNIKHPSDVVKEGDEIDVYIKSIDKEKGKISLGYKTDENNPWKQFSEKYKAGDTVEGVASRIVPFGVFVDIGGVDGLIHISELSWKKINHPSELIKEGQVIEAYIKDINYETKKVSLGYKKIEDNPWEIFKTKYNTGDVIKVKIVRMTSFGAFAEIMEGVDGLIHISQISNEKINKVSDVLEIGQEVEVKITEIKEDTGKVSLSIRALLPEVAVEAVPAAETAEEEVYEMPKQEPSMTALENALSDIVVEETKEEPEDEEKPKSKRTKKAIEAEASEEIAPGEDKPVKKTRKTTKKETEE